MMPDDFAGQTILITGAASGIGQATATMLRDQGARLVLLDCAPIEPIGTDLCYPVDITDEAAVTAAIADAASQCHGIDGLVAAAGIFREAPLTETSASDFQHVLGVNLLGTFLVVRETVRAMRAFGNSGRIVTFSSELAALGREGHAAYCASKAGIGAMTRCWARELGPDILVNAVAPGPTDTPMLNFEALAPRWQAAETANPLRRIGQPDEIARVVCFLLGQGGSFITGQTIGVNGGAVMV